MKKFILLLSIFISLSVYAQKVDNNMVTDAILNNIIKEKVNDALGNTAKIKTIKKDDSGNTVFRDENGSIILAIKKDGPENMTVEDGSGHILLKVGINDEGNTLILDGNGELVLTIAANIFDNNTLKEKVYAVYRLSTDIFGNTIVKDEKESVVLRSDDELTDATDVLINNGRDARKISKDLLGNYTIKDGKKNVLYKVKKTISGNIEAVDNNNKVLMRFEKSNETLIKEFTKDVPDYDEQILLSLILKLSGR